MAARILAVVAAAFLIVAPVSAATITQSSLDRGDVHTAAPIEKPLLAKFKDGKQRFVVEFTAKTDLRAATRGKPRAERGTLVYKALAATAKSSQAEALKVAASAKGSNPKSYWLTNSLLVTGDARLARRLAAVSGVSSVHAQKIYPLVKPVKSSVVIQAAAGDPEWGVEKIGADQAWAEGITGQGITVANVDTGVDFSHPALVENYRGNNHDGTFSHDYNWWDPAGICGGEPCDNVGHGTHTMGTIAGGDGPGPFTPDTGVAPGATWFAAKGCEDLGCSSESLLSAGQFILAPTDLEGNNPDPSRRPDIVNNSWGSDDPNDTFYLETVQAWRAAGIIPVFSAGNAGEFGCGTAGTPGNFPEVISLGATDIDDNIASFSSRGPSPTDKVSPNISAPGVNVVSSVPGGGYATFSGTSMASPHATGTIALMLSSKTSLIGDFNTVLDLLNLTAIDRPDDECGTPDPSDNDPNFVYGEGRIDAKAAVDLAKEGGTLSGTVSDADTSDPIAGAHITADNGEREFNATTDGAGNYSLFLASGSYTVSASAFGYETAAVLGTLIVTDETTIENFDLTPLPRFTVSGTVTSAGSPLEDASVVAVGTPVDPATTDAAGHYALILPIGAYTLQASLGGCTDSSVAEISSTGDDVVQDFALVRKIDNYGHACRPIAFDWVDADGQTALYGDDNVGFLRLPFDFPFYGESYNRLYVTTNGFVNFLEPNAEFFPSGIPSSFPPNAAIYALWRDIVLDEEASVDYATIGSGDAAAFVIEYSNVRYIESDVRVTFEMKLWANGNIDLLYGDNPNNAADGGDALIGIEDQTGSDALQIGLFERVVGPNTALRIETLPVAILSGTVIDANDDLPISGASVTAEPGSRSAATDADGQYQLRLVAGSYDVTASKAGYDPVTQSVTLSEGELATLDFALSGAIASVEPTSIEASVEFGETSESTVRLSNSGSAALIWEAKERLVGVTLPDLPPAIAGVFRTPSYSRIHLPPMPLASVAAFDPGSLPIVIDDPDNDSNGPVEILDVRGEAPGAQMNVAVDYSTSTPFEALGGVMYLDTDQDPATGLPPEAFSGLPTQDIGFDYFATFPFVFSDGIVPVFNLDGDLVAEVPASIDGSTVSFAVPLEALGNDDGNVDIAMDNGTFGPEDWAPDVGHGTIQSFAELSWIDEDPASGEIGPGGFDDILITLGGATLAPGDYQGQVVFVSNAPKTGQVAVDVTLHVTKPDEFGRVTGTITDAHSSEPIGGALVTLHATWLGSPLDFETTTDPDGTWSVIGPEGTWPVDVTLDGYVPESITATIVRGVTTGGADAALHLIQPHAGLDDSPIVFILTPDRTDAVVRTVTNAGGHEDLTFTIGEVNLDAGTQAIAGVPTAQQSPTGVVANYKTARGVPGRPKPTVPASILADGDVLASWNAGLSLPWGVGYTGDVWLSDPIDLLNVQFTAAGDRLNDFPNPTNGEWGADMAFDPGHGLIWQVSVGGDNGIYGFDPTDGSVQEVITGDPWTGTSQRGLAYDPAADVFYIGGWNEGTVYRVAGLSHPTPGETLSQCNPADPGISGLAWNGSFGMLWEATNSDTDTIYLLDPATCDTVRALPHPDGGGFGGAGIETDVVGNLWLTGQNSGNAYLVESGLPNFTDVPWLSVEPTEGTVGIDGSQDLTIAADTAGLASGVYRAIVVVQTNDPDHSTFQIPVTLVVPAYQQGIDPGTGSYLDPDTGVLYAADRAFTTGGFGYVGSSSTRSTTTDIAGTDREALYNDLRTGMTAYRFSVPNGTYRVDLAFAELLLKKAGQRVFGVSIEGTNVLSSFDVFAEAGGRNTALDRTFMVVVTDGVLDITFVAQRGDSPIINGILVTEMPPGSEGL